MVSHHFKEELWVDQVELLDQVFAYQESTHNKLWAGANESFTVWLVSLVQQHCYWCSHCFLPLSFEVLPPPREFTKASDLVQHHFKLSVVYQCKLCNQDPCKQIEEGQTEVIEVILLHVLPTTRDSKSQPHSI